MPEWTNIAGCAIAGDFIYLAQTYDDYGLDVEFTRMVFYDGQSPAAAWSAHDLRWNTVSACVWRNSRFGPRVYVAMSDEGDVEIVGPSAQPQLVERIAGAGLNRPDSSAKGLMMRIRQIGAHLFACGSGYLTFRRDERGWTEITLPEERSVSAAWSTYYIDINGHSEDAVFAVGPDSTSTSRVSFYDGKGWSTILSGTPGTLTVVAPSRRGGVYVGGSQGVLLYDGGRKRFDQAMTAPSSLNILDALEFGEGLYLATTAGLFLLREDESAPKRVVTGLEPELTGVSLLSSAEGVLWSLGSKDLAFYDGVTWTRLHDPENPKIGR